jgi:hypothetical protein
MSGHVSVSVSSVNEMISFEVVTLPVTNCRRSLLIDAQELLKACATLRLRTSNAFLHHLPIGNGALQRLRRDSDIATVRTNFLHFPNTFLYCQPPCSKGCDHDYHVPNPMQALFGLKGHLEKSLKT